MDSKQLYEVTANVNVILKMRKLRIKDTWLVGMDMRYVSGSYSIKARALNHHSLPLSKAPYTSSFTLILST